ncbi:MAG: hypothetical protein WBN92_05545 [Terriglobia bacterium]
MPTRSYFIEAFFSPGAFARTLSNAPGDPPAVMADAVADRSYQG